VIERVLRGLAIDEAVDLLNTVLNKNGYAAIRNGRTLRVVSRDDARTKDIPVKSGSDPEAVLRTVLPALEAVVRERPWDWHAWLEIDHLLAAAPAVDGQGAVG
jgi:hypothetical protein